MAFPQVASATNTNSPGPNTHLVLMPVTVNAGDLLITVISHTHEVEGTFTGWTNLGSGTVISGWRLSVWYKIAAGTEGATTVNYLTAGNLTTAAQVFRITGWHGTTPPEIAISTGTSTTPDPPNLTPSWGSADTLWLAALASDGQPTVTISAYPSSYTNGTTTGFNLASSDSYTSTARRELAAASENPGTFTSSLNTHFAAGTIGIRPTAAPAVPTAPSSLVATAISTTQIDLTWTDNSSDETSFRIERSPNGSTGWASVGTNAAGDNTFSNTGLTCGTQYFYRVFAVNAVGDSTASNTANATTSACPPAPPSTGGNRMGGTGAIRRPPRPTSR